MHLSASQANGLIAPITEKAQKTFVLPVRADALARYLPFLCVMASSALILSLALFFENTLSFGAIDHGHQAPAHDELLVASYNVLS